jgi:hypothetical protein
MTTQPPPSYVPTGPGQPRPSGVVALVIGIVLCSIAFFPALGAIPQLILGMLSGDGYYFGRAIGVLIVAAIFGVPGFFLIRRYVRIRRQNNAADAAAASAYGYPAAGYAAPPAGYTPPAYAPASETPAAPAGPPIPAPPAPAFPATAPEDTPVQQESGPPIPAPPAPEYPATAPEETPAQAAPPVPPADPNVPPAVPPIAPPR